MMSPGGMGIGLALARQLAIQMNGTMSVQSELGQGSHFWFTATFSNCRQPSPPPSVEQAGQGINVVVVAENSELRKSLVRSVECMGFSALELRLLLQVGRRRRLMC